MSIEIQNLVKRFGEHLIVDHVSLSIRDGELFVLLGPSGSGKSTVLRMIAGLIPVTEGRIILHGRDVTDLAPQERDTGFVFQNYSLFRHMTVADNIEFGLAVRNVPKATRAARRDELLDMVGLAGLGKRYPSQLSGGQQQRVAVARALAFEPSVLLLDEPFGALDVKIRAQLRQSLKEVQRRLGVTTILVTHDQEEAFELADRIGIIDRGRLLEVGTPDELYRQPQHEFVATFLGSANLLAGAVERDRVRLGALTLSYPASSAHFDAEGRAEVLFRPEDLVVVTDRSQLESPVLGAGVVEEVLFLGTLRRVRVRLEALPGTWPLPTRYGEEGVALEVALLSDTNNMARVQPGQKVWVGIKHFHILPRIALRLLVCTDRAEDADSLLQVAGRLGRDTGGTLTVLALNEASAGASEDPLDRIRATLDSALPNVRVKACQGAPAEEILREAGTGEYDLVLVGGHMDGRRSWAVGGMGSRPMSTVEQIVRESPISVLVVRDARPAIKRVLLCSAGGEPGKVDVLFGGRLARRAGAAATLLYVQPAHPVGGSRPLIAGPVVDGLGWGNNRLGAGEDTLTVQAPVSAAWVARHLEAGRLTLLGQGVHVDAKVRQGAVVDEILAEAAEGEYDLIVVGGHIPSTRSSLLERDIASEVVAQADRLVLVVRGKVV